MPFFYYESGYLELLPLEGLINTIPSKWNSTTGIITYLVEIRYCIVAVLDYVEKEPFCLRMHVCTFDIEEVVMVIHKEGS